MNCKIIVLIIVLFNLTSFGQKQANKKQPNILFILSDDLGWGDLGLNFQNDKTGKRHFTPELDAMGNEGVRMIAHYCPSPICAPSRASLLTGQHQGHSEVRDRQFDKALPDQLTLGSVMQMAGYSTVMVGKYGLQGVGKDPESWSAYPTKRGFDEFFGYPGHLNGHIHYPYHHWPIGDQEKHRTPKELWHQNEEISSKLEGCYTTDLFTAFAKKWIIDHQKSSPDKPFMMMLTYDTPHAALQLPSTPYPEGKGLSGGMQWIGQPGHMINTADGVIDSYIHPDYRNDDWSDVERRFATSVRRIDEGVGDLLQLLRDLGIDENTLVVFTSDNGPHDESYIAGENYAPTSFRSYGPYDGAKSDIWEGGIRVPSLAWWPKTIPAGYVDSLNSQFHDWMATFVELAGFPRPAICDGINLMPHLTGRGTPESSTVYVEYMSSGTTQNSPDFEKRKRGLVRKHMHAVFLDGYKGVRVDIKSNDDDFEIYDVSKDPGERNNLAHSSPYFTQLDKRMKDRVLQLHHASEDAPRPYDHFMIPAVLAPSKIANGLRWKAKEGECPWVAQLALPSESSLIGSGKMPRFHPGNLYQADGLIQIPENGKVVLHVKTQGQVVIKIDDNVVLQQYGTDNVSVSDSDEMNLAKGLHPIHIFAKDMKDNAELELSWTINGQTVLLPEGALVYPIGK
jgi:uncharacterized sulfatase